MPRWGWLVALVFLGGCASPDLAGQEFPIGVEPHSSPRGAAVAVVDSGINPYHDIFRDLDGSAASVAPRLVGPDGRPAIPVALSRAGDLGDRIAADRSLWDQLDYGRLYWFEGTRVLGIAASPRQGERVPVLDEWGHGTAVASVLAQVSSSALILAVETEISDPEASPLTWLSPPAEALALLARVPWVDGIVLSIGPPASLPWPGGNDVAEATRDLTEVGKLVFGAAGNQPTHPLLDPYKGPPWIVSVSGSFEAAHGRALMSAQATDVVAQYKWPVAPHDRVEGLTDSTGTSFAAPSVAGVVAEALLHLRAKGHVIAPVELRPYLNATAAYWQASDWSPGSLPDSPEAFLETSLPILLPWQQMGWGHVGPEQVAAIVGAVTGEALPPPKPPEAVAWMAAQQAAREAYWRFTQPPVEEG